MKRTTVDEVVITLTKSQYDILGSFIHGHLQKAQAEMCRREDRRVLGFISDVRDAQIKYNNLVILNMAIKWLPSKD